MLGIVARAGGEHRGDGGVQPGARLRGQVAVDGLADEVVGEPVPATGQWLDQLGLRGRSQWLEQVGRRCRREGLQRGEVELAAQHRGSAERPGHPGQPGDPGADGLADARRDGPVLRARARTGGEQPPDLGDEQRIPAGAVDDRRGEVPAGRPSQCVRDQRRDRGGVERGEPHPGAGSLQGGHHLAHLRVPACLDGPVGADQQHRRRADLPGQEQQQAAGRAIGDVQVVEQHHQGWSVGGRPQQHAAHALAPPASRLGQGVPQDAQLDVAADQLHRLLLPRQRNARRNESFLATARLPDVHVPTRGADHD